MQSFSEAFASQAESDLDAYESLTETSLPVSHRLHYLQMWLEKLCKAYLWLPDSQAEDLRMKHNVVDKVLPRLIGQYWQRLGFQEKSNLASIREICREIDLLHPQVDDGGRRPQNVEYPWRDRSGQVNVPFQHTFPVAHRLYGHSGRTLLKAAISLTRHSTIFTE